MPGMERRHFVSASLAGAAAAVGEGAAQEAKRAQLFELRQYRLRFGPMESRFAEHAKTALVPALNRAGIAPVGAFTVSIGPDNPSLYLLLPHAHAESLLTLDERLESDAEYRRVSAAIRALPPTDPPYERLDSSLMTSFKTMPALKPAGPLTAGRVAELRRYESPNEPAGRKKIEMFEEAGEIAIFRRLGMTPVFFARNLVGPRLPALTYMLMFPDVATREKCWAAFREDPEWVKLRTTPGYSNADILTGNNVQFLRPADYSQI